MITIIDICESLLYSLFTRLSVDIGQLLDFNHNYDVIITVGEELKNIKDFHAHSLILGARSSYFRSAFSNNWTTRKENGFIHFKKPNISPKVFQVILKYIYSGVVDFENHQLSDILEILIAADELILDELTEHVQVYLMEETFWLPENIVQVIQTVFPFETCKNLQNHCTEIICHNPKIIFESDDFYKMDKQILVNLLKRSDFAISEYNLWNNLIKWGISQISTSLDDDGDDGDASDMTRWKKDEFKMLGEVLRDCIPEIRFFQMTSDEVYKAVYPYRKILPKDLKHDIICFHLSSKHVPESLSILPSRKKNVDILFISPPQVSLIESWIDCTTVDHLSLTTSATKLRYQWNLLYQGSRDGFSPVVFHEKCDNKGPCVVITKIRNSTTIIGGYNPIGWYSSYGYYEETHDSFIYLFKNFYDLKNCKLSRVTTPENAIFQQNEFGPDFGEPDFLLFGENNETYCTTGCSYEEAIDLGHFEVDDYVVYQIDSSNESNEDGERENENKESTCRSIVEK